MNFLRAILLYPLVLTGLFVLLAPLVAWRVDRFLMSDARTGINPRPAERVVAMLAAVVLLAGVLSLATLRRGAPLGDRVRLKALERSAPAGPAPPAARLLSEEKHLSTYFGMDEYTAGEKDPPGPTSYRRAYRVEGSLPEVIAALERSISDEGWELRGASCGPESQQATPQRSGSTRRYERRFADFRATLALSWTTTPSTVFPGTATSNVHLLLRAPSALTGDPLRSLGQVDPGCLRPPEAAPLPPAPPGACAAADAKLAVVVPHAAEPLASAPLRRSSVPADLRRMRVRASDDEIVASDEPSEPRAVLERHSALDGYQAYDEVHNPGIVTERRREATYAYRFPTHEKARAFHQEAVGRACPQAVEAFAVPGVADAVGLRLYVRAPGETCGERRDLQWGIGPGACEEDWVIESVAFVRGQYFVSVAVGGPERESPDLAAQRDAAVKLAVEASERARDATSTDCRG